MPSKKKKNSLYTFNQYLDNKDNLGTKTLEAHPCSKKFLSQIFQYNERYIYSNKNFDKFVYDLDLDKLEKLLQPARLIEAHNITNMVCSTSYRTKLDVLGGTLTKLTSNINILKNLYDLHIPFSIISGRLRETVRNAPVFLKNTLQSCKLKMENWPGNTYEEICKRKAYVLNFLKKGKLKSYDINSANDDIDNNIMNPNPLYLYITNNNKLENHSCSMKLFLSAILQKNQRLNYSNENLDKFIDKLELDKLEKLLQPVRLIEAHNITGIMRSSYTIDLDLLADTLKILTSNIDILKALYDLEIPFSTISGKLSCMGSKMPVLFPKIFEILDGMRKAHKNDKEFLRYFEKFERKLYSVKNTTQQALANVINSEFEKINSQEPNNLTINNNQSQIIDKHREDDIENSSNEINTHSDSQKLDISDSELEAIHHMDEMILLNSKSDYANQSQPIENYIDLYLEDCDLAKNSDEINTHSDSQKLDISDSELEAIHHMDEMILLNSKSDYANQSQPIENYIDLYLEDCDIENYIDLYLEDCDLAKNSDEINTHSDSRKLAANISNSANNQSQPIEGYQENNIENLQIIRQVHTEEVMQSVEKRKSCYDEHEDHPYTRKRQCNNHELNSDHGTEVALNEPADSINVDCPTSVTISHLAGKSTCIFSEAAGESTYIISDTAGYSAYILE
ncbi:hypothetical protein [Orientia tsutsugamushi]|uniref:Repeat-containing protein D n=1 Tax=Orientia tsutsugamushi (strain Boryong) TaxID=357244 RepID=A5CCB3_ORITB|nr:hypothetical protein [Orientia tsutsugamushi]CAM79306.1 hypothetical protein OTBS_0240 [Orientia tsutsugamushi str. Boryong]